MDYQLNTRLNGNIAMTSSYHERASLQRDKTLYKFIWVQSGTLTLEIDHIPMRLEKDEIVTLTPLHHLEVKEVDGEYLTFVFNSNFYCIYGHDNEVSCNGFLFYGSSQVMMKRFKTMRSISSCRLSWMTDSCRKMRTMSCRLEDCPAESASLITWEEP